MITAKTINFGDVNIRLADCDTKTMRIVLPLAPVRWHGIRGMLFDNVAVAKPHEHSKKSGMRLL